ncbi:MAG: hypothetical protein E6H67_06855 [Betaproteobacteria bacterium]|nr:MAG: hypothetical protein E6H67_06855 [Betaproteobacteria bacterium]
MRHQLTLAVVFLVALSPSAAFADIQTPDSPIVYLIAPRRDARFVTPAAPVFYAIAYAGSTSFPSSIAYVEFLDGETVIARVTAPNSDPVGQGYAFVWQNPPLGLHLIYARATDTFGHSAIGPDRIIVSIVDSDPPVQVALSSPATGQIFTPANPEGRIRRRDYRRGHGVPPTIQCDLEQPAAG